jgi:outer membrane protein TolC
MKRVALRHVVVLAALCSAPVAAKTTAAETPPAAENPPAAGTPVAVTPSPLPGELQAFPVHAVEALLGQPGGLTAAKVAERAVRTSPTLQSRRRDLEAAVAQLEVARTGYWPRVDLSARYTRLSPLDVSSFANLVTAPNSPAGTLGPNDPLVNVPLTFPILLNNTTFQASLTVPLLDYLLRLPSSTGSAKELQEAARWNEVAALRQTRNDARVSYYQWVRARLQTVLAGQALERSRQQLAVAQRKFEVGTASKADVLRVESQVAADELLRRRSELAASSLEESLRIIMHEPGAASFEIGESLEADVASPFGAKVDAVAFAVEGAPRVEPLVQAAWEHRPELRAAERNVEALRQQVRTTKAGYLPKLELFADLVDANPNQRIVPQQSKFKVSWDVGAQLTWSPNDAWSSRSAVHAAESKVAHAEAQLAALRDAVRSELTVAVQATGDAESAIRTTVRELTSAEESYRVRYQLFEAGRATNVELLDAQTELTRARLNAVDARIDRRIARSRLMYVLGLDL